MSRKTGIVKDSRYLQHTAGFSHPESSARLAAIYEMLDNPDTSWKYSLIDPREATHDEIAYVHTPRYIDFIASTAGKSHVFLDPDTMASADTYDVAKLAAGGLLAAIDSVVAGEVVGHGQCPPQYAPPPVRSVSSPLAVSGRCWPT